MKLPPLLRKLSATTGFSLVEVSIAIAVAGISIFSVVGLMPTLLDYDQRSGANSIVPTLATQALGAIKKERAVKGVVAVIAKPHELFFTRDGALLLPADEDHSSNPEALYKCTPKIVRMSDAKVATNYSDTKVPDPGDHCLYATMTFTWPVGTPPAKDRTRTFHATITDE